MPSTTRSQTGNSKPLTKGPPTPLTAPHTPSRCDAFFVSTPSKSRVLTPQDPGSSSRRGIPSRLRPVAQSPVDQMQRSKETIGYNPLPSPSDVKLLPKGDYYDGYPLWAPNEYEQYQDDLDTEIANVPLPPPQDTRAPRALQQSSHPKWRAVDPIPPPSQTETFAKYGMDPWARLHQRPESASTVKQDQRSSAQQPPSSRTNQKDRTRGPY